MNTQSFSGGKVGGLARLVALALLLLFPAIASAARDGTYRAPERKVALPQRPHVLDLLDSPNENSRQGLDEAFGPLRLAHFLVKPDEFWASSRADRPLAPEPVEYGFQGREKDSESGLQFFRARSYDPMTGRFTSRDPVTYSNLYVFATNDPTNNTDPSGRDPAETRSSLVSGIRDAIARDDGSADDLRRKLDYFDREFGGWALIGEVWESYAAAEHSIDSGTVGMVVGTTKRVVGSHPLVTAAEVLGADTPATTVVDDVRQDLQLYHAARSQGNSKLVSADIVLAMALGPGDLASGIAGWDYRDRIQIEDGFERWNRVVQGLTKSASTALGPIATLRALCPQPSTKMVGGKMMVEAAPAKSRWSHGLTDNQRSALATRHQTNLSGRGSAKTDIVLNDLHISATGSRTGNIYYFMKRVGDEVRILTRELEGYYEPGPPNFRSTKFADDPEFFSKMGLDVEGKEASGWTHYEK